MTAERPSKRATSGGKSHMPENSVFFEKIIPILFTGLGILMVVLILFAIAVLAGWIKF
jgi:hypothetical protein